MSEHERTPVVEPPASEPPARGEPDSHFVPVAHAEGPAPPVRDATASLARVEKLLSEIRSQLELAAREQRHQEFSFTRLVGALAQALVIGFLIAALADWAYSAPAADQLVKIGFAAVFQLGALTAFLIGPDAR